MPKTKTNAKTVDEYLADIPESSRGALEKLRKTIKSVVPDSTEVISYHIPIFKYQGRLLVGFGAAKDHCSFYLLSASTIPAHKDKLKSYHTAKGTIHFPADKPLPAVLVKTLVKARIAENEKLGKKK